MFHRYQFGGCTWAHQSEQTCSAFVLWLGHAILNYPHYINCDISGILGGYTGVNRYTPPHFQTHPYHGSMGDPDPVEKRTRSASCDPWPRGWSRSKGVSLKSCVGSESQRFRSAKNTEPNGKVYCLICLYTMEKDWVKCAEVGLWDKAPAYRSNTAEEMQQARGGFWLDWRIQPCTWRKVLAVQTCPK